MHSVLQAHPTVVASEVKRIEALKLRMKGYSYRQISETLSCAISTAHNYIGESLAEVRAEGKAISRELLELELHRLDDMQSELWDQRKDPTTANTILRVMERRAKLLGLDAATPINLFSDPPATAGMDLKKLTVDELVHLLRLMKKAKNIDEAPITAALNPGDEVFNDNNT